MHMLLITASAAFGTTMLSLPMIVRCAGSSRAPIRYSGARGLAASAARFSGTSASAKSDTGRAFGAGTLPAVPPVAGAGVDDVVATLVAGVAVVSTTKVVTTLGVVLVAASLARGVARSASI